MADQMDALGSLDLDDLDIPALEDLLRDPLLEESALEDGSTGFYCESSDSIFQCMAERFLNAASPDSSAHSFVMLDVEPSGAAGSPETAPSSNSSHAKHTSGQPTSCEDAKDDAASSQNAGQVQESRKRAACCVECGPQEANNSSGGADSGSEKRETSSSGPSTEESEEERKKQARMLRNRESAQLSRQRKKMQLEDKERQCQQLQSQNTCLTAMVGQLTRENAALRQHLAQVCQQSGQPFPPALLVPQPPVPPNAAYPTQFSPPPSMVGGVPKIPIQRLKPARPAPAPAVNKGSASGTQSKKRRFNAVAKGTTTTLAALCCLFLFYSPTLPGFQAPGGFHADSPHSTALQLADVKPLTGRGRVLQAVPGNESLVAMEEHSNRTAAEMVLYPLDSETEQRSLQHLKDLAPSAVLSSLQSGTDGFSLGPWQSFEALADSVFLPQGLASAAACEKVFTFDSSAVEKAAKAAGGRQGASRRALALPPIGEGFPSIEEEGEEGKNSCEDEGDYVISVMLPTKETPDDTYTGLDKLYVVVLNPSRKYTTYSCSLKKTILV